MFKKLLFTTLLLSIYLLVCKNIYKTNEEAEMILENNNEIALVEKQDKANQETTNIYKAQTGKTLSTSIGSIIIPQIKLQQPLFPINNKNNTIEKNVAILYMTTEPNEDKSIIFLAAHSGTGKKAYFNNLNQLSIEDEIILIYKSKEYIYKIKNIWEVPKTGNINVEKTKDNQLVLTTCSEEKENYQLIINSIQIKKES